MLKEGAKIRATDVVLRGTECFESVNVVCDWKEQNVNGLFAGG